MNMLSGTDRSESVRFYGSVALVIAACLIAAGISAFENAQRVAVAEPIQNYDILFGHVVSREAESVVVAASGTPPVAFEISSSTVFLPPVSASSAAEYRDPAGLSSTALHEGQTNQSIALNAGDPVAIMFSPLRPLDAELILTGSLTPNLAMQ